MKTFLAASAVIVFTSLTVTGKKHSISNGPTRGSCEAAGEHNRAECFGRHGHTGEQCPDRRHRR